MPKPVLLFDLGKLSSQVQELAGFEPDPKDGLFLRWVIAA